MVRYSSVTLWLKPPVGFHCSVNWMIGPRSLKQAGITVQRLVASRWIQHRSPHQQPGRSPPSSNSAQKVKTPARLIAERVFRVLFDPT